MFDVGFSELMVIGIVALLVLGPERLPKVARTTGHLLGRLQRYVADVKSDISREMQLDELKRLQEEARQSAISLESTVRSEMAGIEKGVSSSLQSASSAVADLENSIKAPVDGSAAASSFDHDAASAQLDRQLAEADTHAGPAPAPAVAEEPKSEPVPPEPKSIKS